MAEVGNIILSLTRIRESRHLTNRFTGRGSRSVFSDIFGHGDGFLCCEVVVPLVRHAGELRRYMILHV